jgi:chorismate mutase-like protein
MLIDALRHTLAHFESDLPSLPENPTKEDLAPLRDRIDEIDRAVLHLLNERSRCANVIGHIKKKLDLPVYAPRREEDVIRNVVNNNHGPLPNEAVRRLFERVIDETLSLERQRFQDEPES